MAKGFKHGSGGIPLNFKVVCNPHPSTAKENTIWVDTDKINNYYFSATQPENMVEYDVWFRTVSSSAASFNALKKNGIQVYPISAMQYVSGALVDKTAKSYQRGEWVEWFTGVLFDNDNTATIVTQWDVFDNGGNVGSANTPYGTITVGDTIVITAKDYSSTFLYHKPIIDLTHYSKLVVDIQYNRSKSQNKIYVMDKATSSGSNTLAQLSVSGTTRQNVELDISAITEKAYCCVRVDSGDGAMTTATVYKIELIK